MPTKKGAGGRQQNYSSRTGRYIKTDYAKLYPLRELTRREKARRKEDNRREAIFNRARNSKDPLLFDVYFAIETEFPGSVQFVNIEIIDPIIGRPRELDIITKKCIIEVKSGPKPKGALRQFLGQKQFATSKNKQHIVFAPNMPTMAKIQHQNNGITITSNIRELINLIKEYEK